MAKESRAAAIRLFLPNNLQLRNHAEENSGNIESWQFPLSKGENKYLLDVAD